MPGVLVVKSLQHATGEQPSALDSTLAPAESCCLRALEASQTSVQLSRSPFVHRNLATASPPLISSRPQVRIMSDQPPRKKSKWDDDEEEVAREKERRRAQKLAARLATEKDQLERSRERRLTDSPRGSGRSSVESTPRRAVWDENASPRPRRMPRRGREAHPLLESCRSVYCYEVRPSMYILSW